MLDYVNAAYTRPRRSPVTYPSYRLGMEPANKGKKYPAEILSRDEIHALLAACSRRGSAGPRNQALIIVLWRAGLRVAEALALETKDVDLGGGEISILHGKGDRRRTVGIDPSSSAIIERWLRVRREFAREGVPVHVIRRQLGHSSLATTERYIDHLSPQEVIRAMQNRPAWAMHEQPPATPPAP